MLVLTDDDVLKNMGLVFGNSEPGAQLHHLLLVRAVPSALGVPEPHLTVAAIDAACDNPRDAERFVATAILGMAAEPTQPGRPVLAALAMEIVAVDDPATEAAENRARVLQAAGRLSTHADAVEVTQLYAAAADGRRWTGRHWLTGARAGEVDGPTLSAAGSRGVRDGDRIAAVVRRAVGLSW